MRGTETSRGKEKSWLTIAVLCRSLEPGSGVNWNRRFVPRSSMVTYKQCPRTTPFSARWRCYLPPSGRVRSFVQKSAALMNEALIELVALWA